MTEDIDLRKGNSTPLTRLSRFGRRLRSDCYLDDLGGDSDDYCPQEDDVEYGEQEPATDYCWQEDDAVLRQRAAATAITCELIAENGEQLLDVSAQRNGKEIWRGTALDGDEGGLLTLRDALACATVSASDLIDAKLVEAICEARGRVCKQNSIAAPAPANFLSGMMTSEEFDQATFQRAWLVEQLLVLDEPVIVGGPKKSLKTSIIVDLAISLSSGAPFLGKFSVPKRVPVLMLSGESGKATLQDCARRVCKTTGLRVKDCSIIWHDRLPKLSDDADLSVLAQVINDHGIKAVFVDPMYLCLIQAGMNLSASNFFHTGPLLERVGRACWNSGATPILVHHARKESQAYKTRTGEPIDLDDLSYSGFAEYARQWLLINRREPFDPGSGIHKLWLSAGGSAGQSGCWGLDIDEGQFHNDFTGREWKVRVLNNGEVRQEVAVSKAADKESKKTEDLRNAKLAIVQLLANYPFGETFAHIREHSECKKCRVKPALVELLLERQLEEVEVEKSNGKGTKSFSGYRLKTGVCTHALEVAKERMRQAGTPEATIDAMTKHLVSAAVAAEQANTASEADDGAVQPIDVDE